MAGFNPIQNFQMPQLVPQRPVYQQPVYQTVYQQPIQQQTMTPAPVYQTPVYTQTRQPVANTTVTKPAPRHSFDPTTLPAQYKWLTRSVSSQFALPQPKTPYIPQQSQVGPSAAQLATKNILPTPGPDGSRVPKYPFKNDLKTAFQTNQSIIEGITIRTFGAEDADKDGLVEFNEGESGTFLNAINRLDELKNRGINTLHVLPISEVGNIKKLGEAGSIYAPLDYIKISEQYNTPGNGLSVRDEFKLFVNECHKRGIKVMVDLPSCGSIDMTKTHPDWFLRDRQGELKVPGSWVDIRMFDPEVNHDTGELRQGLYDYHVEFVRNLVDIGVDGIRADVARAKPVSFWKPLIEYSRQLDPEFGWLAESYIHEDASPMANIPADRPEDLLRAGFDIYYGQYHILQSMKNASEVHKYVIDNINMSHRLPKGVGGMIGSFYTHDDKSVMNHGGALYCHFAATLLNTLPMVNPYFINGFETGDPKQMDIFNYVDKPGGKNPQLHSHIAKINEMREKYVDVIGQGHYIPLKVKASDSEDQIMAFARHLNGKTLLVIANKDINARHIGKIEVPTLQGNQQLLDLVPPYGAKSRLAAQNNAVAVDLAPGRVHVFEINTPEIMNNIKEAHRQNL